MEILESDYFHVITIDNKNVKDENVTMRINLEDHQVSGHTSCNTYGADFIQNGTSINVGMARVTKRYCEGRMKTERLFLSNLRDTKFYSFDGEKLKLQSAEGDVLIVAKRMEED